MRVVEQERKAAAARTQPADRRNQLRIIPFMDDHEVRAPGLRSALFRPRVGSRAQLGISFAERLETGGFMVLQQVLEAPRAFGLENAHVMSAGDPLAEHAAQE